MDLDIEVIVFIIPTKEMVYQALFPDPADREIDDLRYRTLLTMLDELKIAYIDLLPIFRSAASRGEQLYFEIDGHWNPNGHRLAAQALLGFLNSADED